MGEDVGVATIDSRMSDDVGEFSDFSSASILVMHVFDDRRAGETLLGQLDGFVGRAQTLTGAVAALL